MNACRCTILVLILGFALFTFPDTVASSDDLVGSFGMFGDFDGDGDVDALDYNAAQICASFSGPNILVPPACLIFDSNEDGDVDLEDLAAFLEVYTGSLGGVVVEAGELFPVLGGIGIYYSGEPGTAGNNALHGVAAQANYTQDDLWYSWSVDSQPIESGDVVMANAASPSTAYMILSDALPGRYVFRLVVTNLITLQIGEDTSFLDITACACEPGQECDADSGECVAQSCTTVADCGDGDLCTDDVCVNTVCEFTAVSCPQGNTCDPETGGCVDIHCTQDNDCDDDLHCNGVETCVNNLCTDGAPPCDDGIECTDDTCDEGTQTCGNVTNNANCSDNATCSSDVCAPGAPGADLETGCVFTNINGNCTDQFTCTVNTCDPENVDAETVTGCVFTPDDAACDDSVGCTTDTCDPADAGTDPNTGCVNEPDDASCDNGTFCDGVERCDLVNDCESPGNPCTGTTPICDGTPDACAACASDGECAAIGLTTCDLGTGSCS